MPGWVRRGLVIAAVAAFFAISLLLVRRLRMEEDITAMLPDKDPVVNDYRFLAQSFRAIDSLFIDVGAEPGGSAKDVVAVADALESRLRDSGMFASILYRAPLARMADLLEKLSAGRPCLLSEADLAAIDRRLTLEGTRRRMAAAWRMLVEPSGAFLRSQVQRDPLGLDELVFAKLKGLHTEAGGAQVMGGCIWSEDGRHVLMIATPRFPAMDTRQGAPLVATLDRAREEALRAAPRDAVRISYVGGHRAAVDNAQTIKKDVSRTLTATSIGILLVGILFFRRRSYVALMFLPAAFGMSAAAAAFAIFNPLVSGIALGCGAVVVGLAVDYGIHILYRLDQPGGEARTVGSCVRALILPLTLSAGTTAVGVLCLLLSSLPGERQMGVAAALGVAGAALFAATALPAFIPRLGKRRGGRVLPLAEGCGRLLAWRQRHGRAIGLLGLAVLVASLVGLTRLRFEGDVDKLNYLRPANREDSDRLLAVWGRLYATSVVVRGPSLEEALRTNDRLFPVLQHLEQEGKVTSFSSVSSLLPALQTQEENKRRWREFWSGERGEKLRTQMAQASSELKFGPKAFQPFYDSLGEDPTPMTLADFEGTGLDRLIQGRIAQTGSEYLVLTSYYPKDRAALAEVASRIRQAIPRAVIVDRRQFVEHTSWMVQNDLKRLAVAAGFAVAAFLYLFLLRLELVVTAMIPVCLSVLVTLGLLGLFGIPINLISSLFIVFVFGAGIDYSIYFLGDALSAYRGTPSGQEAEKDATTCGAVFLCAVTTLCGFATLAFAKHPALFSLGITGSLGMIASLGTAILVVPPITRRLFPLEGRFGTPSLKTFGGTLWAYGYLGSRALLYAIVLRPLQALWYCRDRGARERFARKYLYAAAHGLLRDWPYRHSERLYINASPEVFRPPAIIVSNHPSAFDIMVILALPADMVMVVKRWVWDTPIMGLIVRDCGHILAGDDGTAEAVLERSQSYLKRGVCVMYFPEGSRSPDEKMHRFHHGAFELAIRTGADIIPVYLSDTQSCIAPRSFWIGNHRSVAHVLPRVTPHTFDYGRGARALAAHVKQQMLAREHSDWRIAEDGKVFWHNLRSLYNYRGPYVESYVGWKLRLDPIYRHVDSLVPEGGDVLDLGCGYGLMSNLLARKSRRRRVLGVDLDERKVRIAQRTALAAPNVRFELQDFLTWDYPAADAVVMVDVLHYWSEEKQRSVIAKAAACLRPGGVLVFRDASRSASGRHRLVTWVERFSTATRANRPGDGLCFGDRNSYLRAFQEEGLTLVSAPSHLGRGSNVTFVLRKDARCGAA